MKQENKKQTVNLNEDQIIHMIAESIKSGVNEVHESPDYLKKIESARDGLRLLLNATGKEDDHKNNKYSRMVFDLGIKIRRILDLWEKQELQKTGEQPDRLYYVKHMPTEK